MDRNTQREALSNLGLYGRYMMRQLKDIINEYGTDVGKILNVIRILDYLHVKPNRVVPTSKHKMYTIGVNVIL